MTGFFAIQLFYATQLHVRIAEMQLNGVSINIWRTTSISSKIKDWQNRIFEIEKKLILLREAQDRAERYANVQRSAADVAEVNLRDEIASAVLIIGADNPLDEDSVNVALNKLFSMIREKMKAEPENQSWQVLSREVEAAYEKLSAQRKEAQAADDFARLAKTEVTNADEIKKGTEAESKRLFGLSSNDVGPELVERINNIVSEIEQASSSLVPLIGGRSLIFWPTENLVLALVITMGILGSCLHLMAERFATSGADRTAPGMAARVTLGQALLRLFYGGVMALVVYLVAKASVPILTDTSRIGGQAPLNPYFISFVGIISGLASERAIKQLRAVGEGVFSAGAGVDTVPRYATAILTDAYAKRIESDRAEGKPDPVDRLAAYLGRPRGSTEDAIAGKLAVKPHDQVVMAAFVGVDTREAFSDLSPEGPEPQPKPPPGAPSPPPPGT